MSNNQVGDIGSSYQNDDMEQIFPPEYDLDTMIREHEQQVPDVVAPNQPLPPTSYIEDSLLSAVTEVAIRDYK